MDTDDFFVFDEETTGISKELWFEIRDESIDIDTTWDFTIPGHEGTYRLIRVFSSLDSGTAVLIIAYTIKLDEVDSIIEDLEAAYNETYWQIFGITLGVMFIMLIYYAIAIYLFQRKLQNFAKPIRKH
jgi:hypothetical protein